VPRKHFGSRRGIAAEERRIVQVNRIIGAECKTFAIVSFASSGPRQSSVTLPPFFSIIATLLRHRTRHTD